MQGGHGAFQRTIQDAPDHFRKVKCASPKHESANVFLGMLQAPPRKLVHQTGLEALADLLRDPLIREAQIDLGITAAFLHHKLQVVERESLLSRRLMVLCMHVVAIVAPHIINKVPIMKSARS